MLVNAGMLLTVNAWPGWEAAPFNYRSWVKALGDLATIGVGVVALVWIWQVFPFDFSFSTFDWALVARSVLVLGMIGSIVGILAACISFVRGVTSGASDREA